jgi:Zn-finger nucleic acid-binding protein
MANTFMCPKCRGVLNVREYIVFSAKTGGDNRGLLFISPELGNYKLIKHPSFKLTDGEHIDLFCPICHINLAASEVSENLARVVMVDENNFEYQILFSEIIGEQCTYKMSDNDLEMFGENAPKYMNFFGEEPNF